MIIKRMESECAKIGIVGEDVILTINGMDHMLSVDELNELRQLTMTFWDANSLWQHTSEAKAEREHWAKERETGVPLGLTKTGIIS